MHSYAIGKSGSGKSTLLRQEILANEGGFVLLDPHGDLAEGIADTIDCIYWDATDPDLVIGFNPLKDIAQGQRHLVATQIVSSFKAIWGESWGPRMEYILFHATLLCVDNNLSLLDIPTVLTDSAFRTRCLRRASYRDFWEHEFEAWDDRYRNDAIAPVLNKVGQFVAHPLLAHILRDNTLSLERVIRKEQRLVVNLSTAKMGELPSSLLGSLIVSGIWYAAQKARTPTTLYVDEFHRFATDTFATVLSEARKFGLELFLSHQYLGQVRPELRQAVFGNVGRFISFRVGTEDAPLVTKELDLDQTDMVTDLAPFEFRQRIGLSTTLHKLSPPDSGRGRIQSVRANTRARYSCTSSRVSSSSG